MKKLFGYCYYNTRATKIYKKIEFLDFFYFSYA